jgi:hypothetical protein
MQAYLDPLNAQPPPPTTPQLKSQFVNPRSDESPPRFLASFDGKCSTRGYGYLGGDPNTQSIYHVKWFNKPCFAPGGCSCQGISYTHMDGELSRASVNAVVCSSAAL